MTEYQNSRAVDYLKKIFFDIEPDHEFTAVLGGASDNTSLTRITPKITIAGFNEERRRKRGSMARLLERKGSVYLYGKDQPDYFLTLIIDNHPMVLSLAHATVRRHGYANSLLTVKSPDWQKTDSVSIELASAYPSSKGLTFFTEELIGEINKGTIAGRLGKWVSRKVFGRDLPREKSEIKSIEEAIKQPDEDIISTMVIGPDIGNVSLKIGDPAKDKCHVLSVKQEYNTSKLEFRDVVVHHRTMGREIGAKQALSTYVYFIDVPFTSPANLLIIRHRNEQK